MSHTKKTVARVPLHKRAITVEVFERDDGLWDVDAQLIDTKAYDFPLFEGGNHPAGQPVHQMVIRITIDNTYTIVNAEVVYDAAPYKICNTIAHSYAQLIGLNLVRGFRHDVRTRLAGKQGCTHMTELTNVLPTAAIQAVGPRLNRFKPKSGQETRPFHIDGCHALRANGEIVQAQFPKWYEPSDTTQ